LNNRRIGLWIGLALLAVIATGVDIFFIFPSRPGPGSGQIFEVEIPAGIGPKGLARKLNQAKVISSPGRFSLWLRLTGRLPEIKVGVFQIRDNSTPLEIVDGLNSRGMLKGVRVTVPEGFTLTKIGTAFENAGIVKSGEFIAAATDKQFIRQIGIPGPTAEGYLFPDTYFIDNTATPHSLIKLMHANFVKHLNSIGKLDKNVTERCIILASIVQAETGVISEMPTIAGVYTNRLKRPDFPSHLLQADPTVSYGCQPYIVPQAPSCKHFQGTLGRRQLDDSVNPYNTYKHPGLPPGPICAPGLDAIRAATTPSKTNFFYFVASKSGRHDFSKTLPEHIAAVARYRKNR
jgi:peptidoglycan lytic transglycosylase G